MRKIFYWVVVIVVYALVALILLDDGAHWPRWWFWTFTILYVAFIFRKYFRKKCNSKASKEVPQETKKVNDANAEVKEVRAKSMAESKGQEDSIMQQEQSTRIPEPEMTTEENLRWPLFEEEELRTMGWDFLFCNKQWDEVVILLKKGEYDEAEKKAYEYKETFMSSLMMFDLLLLEAQHRKGDFNACSETYQNTNRRSLMFYSAINKTPFVLEYCEAMLDLQGTIPMWIQAAWKGAHDCLNEVMQSNPPERAYVICIRAFKAALDIGKPLFGGNEEVLIKDYIKAGLSWHPESKILLAMKSEIK